MSISSPLFLFSTMDSISQALKQDMDILSNNCDLSYNSGTRHTAKNVTKFEMHNAKSCSS
jgi:hypothetical protein